MRNRTTLSWRIAVVAVVTAIVTAAQILASVGDAASALGGSGTCESSLTGTRKVYPGAKYAPNPYLDAWIGDGYDGVIWQWVEPGATLYQPANGFTDETLPATYVGPDAPDDPNCPGQLNLTPSGPLYGVVDVPNVVRFSHAYVTFTGFTRTHYWVDGSVDWIEKKAYKVIVICSAIGCDEPELQGPSPFPAPPADPFAATPSNGLVADFSFAVSTKDPAKYSFDGTPSTGDIAKYWWTIDGEALEPRWSPRLRHRFAPGTHTVSLAVSDSIGQRSHPHSEDIVAYQLVIDSVGGGGAVADADVPSRSALCDNTTTLDVIPTSGYWASATVAQQGVKRPFKGLVWGALPPASTVVDDSLQPRPYRASLTRGCFDDLGQQVTVTADLLGPRGAMLNVAELMLTAIGSPVTLRDIAVGADTSQKAFRSALAQLEKLPDLDAAASCIQAHRDTPGATTVQETYDCIASNLSELFASPTELKVVRRFLAKLALASPGNAVVIQAVVDRVSDLVGAVNAYVRAVERCARGADLGEEFEVILFTVNFASPVTTCPGGTVASRVTRLAGVVDARVQVASAVAGVILSGAPAVAASLFTAVSEYIARGIAGALGDTLTFHTSASTVPVE